MSRYDAEFDGWNALEKDEAAERAYAIGVAERLGEYNREELEAIYDEMGTNYNKSMVELAYREGRQEATAAVKSADENGEAVWADLVKGEETAIDSDERPTGGRDGLPEALEPSELLDKQDVDSTEAMDLPDFLER
jgi:hypothetical protein